MVVDASDPEKLLQSTLISAPRKPLILTTLRGGLASPTASLFSAKDSDI
jgi:hypothetical protein